VPKGVGGLADVVKSPSFATGVGLVQYAATQHAQVVRNAVPEARPSMFGRLRRVLSSAF
jgi:hypothetical protein